MPNFNLNTLGNAVLRTVSCRERSIDAGSTITNGVLPGPRPGNLPRTQFRKFVDMVLCRQSAIDDQSERQTSAANSSASIPSSASSLQESWELPHLETGAAECFDIIKELSPYKSFMDDESRVPTQLRETLQEELSGAMELLKRGPLILGENLTPSAARVLLVNLLCNGQVTKLFLELGKLNIFDDRPGTRDNYATNHLRDMIKKGIPLADSLLWAEEVVPLLKKLDADHEDTISIVEIIEIANAFDVKAHGIHNAAELNERGGNGPGSVLLVEAVHTESLVRDADGVKNLISFDRKGKQRAANFAAEAIVQNSAHTQGASLAYPTIEKTRSFQFEQHTNFTASRKPFKHLHQRSYDQIMQMLAQAGSMPSDIAVLRTNLASEINGLQKYRHLVSQRLGDNTQSNKAIAESDIQYARHTIARYNAENPKLNAEVFDSPSGLINYIKKHNGDFSRLRALLRMGNAGNTLHHAAVDICNKDGALTLLFVDPANLAEPNIARAAMAINDALSELSELGPKTGYVAVGAQNSPADCIQFSESYLKKMANEEDFFNKLHERLRANGERLNEEEHMPPSKAGSAEAMEIAKELIENELENINQVIPDARHFFPLSFFKHSHSQKDIEELFVRREAEKQIKVNKDHENRPAQTLLERVATNIPAEGRKHGDSVKRYSISIEKKRLDEIDKTIAFFKQLEKSLPAQLSAE
ncbi:YopJ family acetyltransferase [Herbaspirillum sp. GCM10030257]|uniref:YopJ family acetyltransferase n=1 Tax=Herbaspirillum sp. GCM10030257 TaxID=3273393 RepID=UPI003607421C